MIALSSAQFAAAFGLMTHAALEVGYSTASAFIAHRLHQPQLLVPGSG
jgi:hypothetical protein